MALAGSGCTTVRHMDTAICVQTFLTSLEGVAQPRAEFAHCEDGRGGSATWRRVQLSLVWMQNDFKLLEGKAFDCVFHVIAWVCLWNHLLELGPCSMIPGTKSSGDSAVSCKTLQDLGYNHFDPEAFNVRDLSGQRPAYHIISMIYNDIHVIMM